MEPYQDKNARVGRYLTVADLTRSDIASRKNIDNGIAPEHWLALQDTVTLFDKIKDRFPEAFPSSFYRSAKLNRAVPKSSKTSQHLLGEAVDVDTIGNRRNLEIFNFVKDNLSFDQLILEYPDKDGIPDWVHVSTTRRRSNRGMVLVKLRGEDTYRLFSEYKIGM